MSDHSKKGPQNAAVGTPDDTLRKPYAPPRLRSLGYVNAITLGSTIPSDNSRKKPHG